MDCPNGVLSGEFSHDQCPLTVLCGLDGSGIDSLYVLVGLYATAIRLVEGTGRDHGDPLECCETKEAYFRWADLAQRI